MITIYKSTNNGLETIESPSDGSWVSVISPSEQEIIQVEGFGISADFITHSLDIDERAHTERNDGVVLIVLRLPQEQDKMAQIPYSTVPLGIR